MSYVIKHTLTFNNLAGQSCKLDIEEREAKLGVDKIVCTHSPIQITYDTPSDDIFDPINGSRAVIGLMGIADFQYRSFYTTDNRFRRTSLYIDSVFCWRGFLQPEQGQGEYKSAPNVNRFIFLDQLGALKNITWDRVGAETELSALGAILNQTGLELDLYEAINLYEVDMDMTAADSPLTQAYFNPKVFDGMTYYDALHQILFKYQAIIKQEKGAWTIYRPEEAVDEYVRRYFTFSAGVFSYDSNTVYNPIVATTSANTAWASLVRISGLFPRYEVSRAWKKYKLIQNYGKIDSIVRNGNFEEWNTSINRPDAWSPVAGVATLSFREGDGLKIAASTVANNLNAGFWTQSYDIESDRLKVDVKFTINPITETTVRFQLIMFTEFHGILYYDFLNNEWVGGLSHPSYDRAFSETETVTLSLITENSGVGNDIGTIQIRLIQPYNPISGNNYIVFDSFNIELYRDDINGLHPYPAESDTDVVINPANDFEADDIEIFCADTPADIDAKNIYLGTLFLDAGLNTPTKLWRMPSEDSPSADTLVNRIKNGLSWYYLNPTEILKVTMFSPLLLSSSVIQETAAGTERLYMIKKATWDVKYCKWTIEGYEIGVGEGAPEESDAMPYLQAEDALNLQAEDGKILEAEGGL